MQAVTSASTMPGDYPLNDTVRFIFKATQPENVSPSPGNGTPPLELGLARSNDRGNLYFT